MKTPEQIKKPWPFGYNEWGEIAPWPWLRHLTPWWLLTWINDRYHLCWANMATWKLGYDSGDWALSRGCFSPYDYCGYYDQCSDENRRAGMRCLAYAPEVLLSTKDTP